MAPITRVWGPSMPPLPPSPLALENATVDALTERGGQRSICSVHNTWAIHEAHLIIKADMLAIRASA